MNKKTKAQIAKENGAKSKGPVTPAGKERSRANALKHGLRAGILRQLAQPHSAVYCNEDGRAYFKLLNDLIAHYRPIGPVALDNVRDLATARWEISRAETTKAAGHNRAFVQETGKDHQLPAEMVPAECALNAANSLLKMEAAYERRIDKLHARIARIERRLRFSNMVFPAAGNEIATCQEEQSNHERTSEEPTQPVENTASNNKPLFTDDPSEATRAAYELFFPGRPLIVVEPLDDAEDDEEPGKPN